VTSTLAGYPVLLANVSEPRIGRWTAYVEADAAEAITGSATLTIEGVDFVGAVYAGGIESGRWVGRLVGGTGGLSTTLDPRAYRACPLSVPLAAVLDETGESLADTSETLVDMFQPQWHRLSGAAMLTVAAIATSAGLVWRIGRDGCLWFGHETWPAVAEPGVEIHRIPALGLIETAPLTPAAYPGATVLGVQAEAVITRLDAGSLRQEIWHAIGA
jgi:hypothetical protein